MRKVHVGTAGWTIPRGIADQFPANGSAWSAMLLDFPARRSTPRFTALTSLRLWPAGLLP
jgi:hypothetical protein